MKGSTATRTIRASFTISVTAVEISKASITESEKTLPDDEKRETVSIFIQITKQSEKPTDPSNAKTRRTALFSSGDTAEAVPKQQRSVDPSARYKTGRASNRSANRDTIPSVRQEADKTSVVCSEKKEVRFANISGGTASINPKATMQAKPMEHIVLHQYSFMQSPLCISDRQKLSPRRLLIVAEDASTMSHRANWAEKEEVAFRIGCIAFHHR